MRGVLIQKDAFAHCMSVHTAPTQPPSVAYPTASPWASRSGEWEQGTASPHPSLPSVPAAAAGCLRLETGGPPLLLQCAGWTCSCVPRAGPHTPTHARPPHLAPAASSCSWPLLPEGALVPSQSSRNARLSSATRCALSFSTSSSCGVGEGAALPVRPAAPQHGGECKGAQLCLCALPRPSTGGSARVHSFACAPCRAPAWGGVQGCTALPVRPAAPQHRIKQNLGSEPLHHARGLPVHAGCGPPQEPSGAPKGGSSSRGSSRGAFQRLEKGRRSQGCRRQRGAGGTRQQARRVNAR